jgi:hypothetical protein
MGRPAVELTVTAEDRMQLESIARSQSLPAALSRRAQMILRLADGETNSAVARRPCSHLHFTPTCGSWLNQVERWFALITTQAIRRSSFDSVADLKRKIDEFVKHYNQHPKPFMWTARLNRSSPRASVYVKLSTGGNTRSALGRFSPLTVCCRARVLGSLPGAVEKRTCVQG